MRPQKADEAAMMEPPGVKRRRIGFLAEKEKQIVD